MSAGKLPTLAELPFHGDETYHDHETLARLALIPVDDVALRAAAIEEFDVSCQAMAANGGSREFDRLLAKSRDLSQRLPNIRAATPGGIAWKLLDAIASMREEEGGDDWYGWKFMITSACEDAMNLERQRGGCARLIPE
jgi:hypothetical protein